MKNGFGFLSIIILAAVILSAAFGGGLYWNEAKKQQTLLETGAGAIKRAEELKKQIESRQEQLYGSRTAIQNYTAYNNEKSFGGYNMEDSVILYWYTVPDGASKIRLYRSSSAEGPWVQIRDYPVDGLKYGPVDGVDGTKADIYYKAEAISASGAVLKEYGVLRIPKYINEYDDLESSKIDTSTSSTSLTASWKTYRNEKYGFEVKMPPRWSPDDIKEIRDVYYEGINISLRLPFGSSGLRSVCNFSVYQSSQWNRLQKEAETSKPIFLVSKNDTTYGWGCGHDDYGYRGFEEYNQAIDNQRLKNLPIGPFEEFKKSILSTFRLID